MSDRDPRDDDDPMLDLLRSELSEEHEPPAERVAALRAQAHAHRDELAARSAPAPRTRRRGFLLGGAFASAGAALGIAGFAIVDEALAPPTEPITLSGVPRGVDATAELINHTWGVELLLTVSGLERGRTYDVVYRSADARDVRAGSFVAVSGEQLCRMRGALLRSDTRAIEVRDERGSVVLDSQLA